MKLVVVGATGMVGKVMLEVIEERKFPFSEIRLVASERSKGNRIFFQGKENIVVGLGEAMDYKPDVAFFSAGRDISLEWAPRFADIGCRVIDNSSAWRMDSTKKLIVPEINGDRIDDEDFIVANPNCSTIQLVMALAPIHYKYGISRLIVSTYQSVTGTGQKATKQLEDETQGFVGEKAYPHPIYQNVLPHCDGFLANGYTKEEMKIVNETRKILGDQTLRISATAVRVPVIGGHSESVTLELCNSFKVDEIRMLLESTTGICVIDDPSTNKYPMPIYSQGNDIVYVGRIREDISLDNSLKMWIVSDNLRKGAATNTVQIAEKLIDLGILQYETV